MDEHEYAFAFDMPLTDDGVWLWPDIEVKLGYRVTGESGEIEIRAVYFDAARRMPGNPRRWSHDSKSVDLLKADDATVRGIGLMIKTAAEADEGWQAEALAEAGWEYRGRGGLDPDGQFVHRAA